MYRVSGYHAPSFNKRCNALGQRNQLYTVSFHVVKAPVLLRQYCGSAKCTLKGHKLPLSLRKCMSGLRNDVDYKACLQVLAKSCRSNAVEITLIMLLTNVSGWRSYNCDAHAYFWYLFVLYTFFCLGEGGVPKYKHRASILIKQPQQVIPGTHTDPTSTLVLHI